jgi:hypothetical protein
LAFVRAVLYLLWFALFPRYARKKRKQMIVKFLAAGILSWGALWAKGRQNLLQTQPPRKPCELGLSVTIVTR